MKKIFKALATAACTAALLGAAASSALAAYPDRPIRVLVGYAPGGGVDIIGRFLAQRLAASLGQPVIIENKAGASGTIAARSLATVPPDGYTLFLGESATLVAPALQPGLFDPVKEFQAVAQVGALTYGIAVHPDTPSSTLVELVALIRENPDKFNYGSPGIGNLSHLAAEQLSRSAGLKMEHVPYKGGSPMLADLMSGQIPIGFTSVASLVGPSKASRVRVVGVTSSERSKLFPDVQSVGEIAPGFEAVSNVYIVAPAGTPADVVQVLNEALTGIMKTREAQEFFLQQGSLVRFGTPKQLEELIASEVEQWRELVEEIGMSETKN